MLLSGHAPTSDEQAEVAALLAEGPGSLAKRLLAWDAAMRGEATDEVPSAGEAPKA